MRVGLIYYIIKMNKLAKWGRRTSLIMRRGFSTTVGDFSIPDANEVAKSTN
jgi:hypothetical protein